MEENIHKQRAWGGNRGKSVEKRRTETCRGRIKIGMGHNKANLDCYVVSVNL